MKHGKDIRDASGQSLDKQPVNEVTALAFVLVEQSPGAFRLRCVTNDDLLNEIREQGVLPSFLREIDELYAEFRARFDVGELPKVN